MQRSYQTNFWLFPTPTVFGDAVLAATPSRNFTAADYSDFFDAVGFPEGTRQLELALELTSTLPAPNVEVLHLYGTGEWALK